MTDSKEEPLTAAQMCRVYAAMGTPVLFLPDQLLRLARLLEKQQTDLDAASKAALAALEARKGALLAERRTFHRWLAVAGGAQVVAWGLMLWVSA